MFKYIDNKDRTFLLGAYRGEKSQLEWILGMSPQRYEKLYNIRFNQDLFSQRDGGFIDDKLPDYILIYNAQNPQNGYHLFPCVNSSIKKQSDMEALAYPNPNGNYIVFSLGEEILSEPLDIQKLIQQQSHSEQNDVPFAPKVIKGKDLSLIHI